MVTRAESPEVPETLDARVVTVVRSAIAGHPQGAVRRIVLYLVVCVVLGALAGGGTVPVVIAAVGLSALLLLAITDQIA